MEIDHKILEVMPSNQNIVDLFEGEWTTTMPASSGLIAKPGPIPLTDDGRIRWLNDELGPIRDMNILELGPLDGAHSYMLHQLGPQSVISIEANTRAFLRCLCMKEIFDLDRVHFKLGSFLPYLEQNNKFDLIIASGVLYHMTEPARLLNLLTSRTDKIFIWTHYYEETIISARSDRELFGPVENFDEGDYLGSRRMYPESVLNLPIFSGGSKKHSIWLQRDSILKFFNDKGFDVKVEFEQRDHVNGPAFAICAKR